MKNEKIKPIQIKTSISRFYQASIIVIIMLVLFNPISLFSQSEKELFDQARLALFDRQWDQAFAHLQRLTQMYPKTSYYAQAQFYKGKCCQEKRQLAKALEYYQSFLSLSGNESLKEEAQIAMIDLNFQLYQSGQKENLQKILSLLDNALHTVQYYAAFKLSYAADKVVASRAVPVLKSLIQNEKDSALIDRAKIALMRINPQYVKELARPQKLENATLFIRITDKASHKITFNISIPFALARLALDAMPPEDTVAT